MSMSELSNYKKKRIPIPSDSKILSSMPLPNLCRLSAKIEVNGKHFDVWSDDDALLKSNPVPNLYIDDDTVIFGNLLISKSDKGAMFFG